MRSRLEGDWTENVLPFNQARTFSAADRAFQLTLLPAGHIFGSAMAFIEWEQSSLLYTGDFKLRAGLSAEKCEPRPAEVLVMETTYGRTEYQFPPGGAVIEGIIRFCREALDNEVQVVQRTPFRAAALREQVSFCRKAARQGASSETVSRKLLKRQRDTLRVTGAQELCKHFGADSPPLRDFARCVVLLTGRAGNHRRHE